MDKESKMDFITSVTLILSCSAFVLSVVAYHKITLVSPEKDVISSSVRSRESIELPREHTSSSTESAKTLEKLIENLQKVR